PLPARGPSATSASSRGATVPQFSPFEAEELTHDARRGIDTKHRNAPVCLTRPRVPSKLDSTDRPTAASSSSEQAARSGRVTGFSRIMLHVLSGVGAVRVALKTEASPEVRDH